MLKQHLFLRLIPYYSCLEQTRQSYYLESASFMLKTGLQISKYRLKIFETLDSFHKS